MDIRFSSKKSGILGNAPFTGLPGSMTRRSLPGCTGTGFIEERVLKPGLKIYYTCFNPASPVEMYSNEWPTGFGWIFFLSGKVTYKHNSLGKEIMMSEGMNRIAFQPGTEGSAQFYPGSPIRIITITMTTDKFSGTIGGDFHVLPSALQRAVEGSLKVGAFALNHNNGDIQYILNSLASALSDSLSPGILIEGLTLELLGRHLMLFSSNGHQISLNERKRVIEACHLLVDGMENPPKLIDLAREVGLSPNRLSLGFKSVYGTTPFAHLREIRLNRAYELLVKKEMNVTETAFSVGYESLSHFSKAFFNRFGLKPCEVKP